MPLQRAEDAGRHHGALVNINVSREFGEYLRGARTGFHFHVGLNRWVRMEIANDKETRVRLARNSDEMGAHSKLKMPVNYVVWWDDVTDPVTFSPALRRVAAMPENERPDLMMLDDYGEDSQPAIKVVSR